MVLIFMGLLPADTNNPLRLALLPGPTFGGYYMLCFLCLMEGK